MAVPANTESTITIAGNLREDLSSTVYKLDAFVTPILSMSKKVKAKDTKHQWLQDTIRAAKGNAQVQGDDLTAAARVARPRLDNEVQIFGDVVRLSDTVQLGATAEGKKQMSIELEKELKGHKLDIEASFFLNNAKVTGDGATVPSELAGIMTYLTTNTIAGVGGSDATGDGTDARTDGTTATYVEANLNDTLQSIWEAGGTPTTVYQAANMQTVAAGFTGNAPRRETKVGKVSAMIDVYMTNFGSVDFKPHRNIRERDILVLDDDTIRVAEYRTTRQEALAKTGLSDAIMISTQLTLVVGNEGKIGGIFDRQVA